MNPIAITPRPFFKHPALRGYMARCCTAGLLLVQLTAAPTFAADSPGQRGTEDGGAARRGPPAEAVAACKGLANGQSCNFTGRQGDMRGSCWAPAGKPLACKPLQPPRQ